MGPAITPLEYEQFAGHVAAQMYYAMALPSDEAMAIVRRRIADGTWREAPYEVVNLVCWLDQRGKISDADGTALFERIVDAICEDCPHFEEGIHDALRHLVPWLAKSPQRHAQIARLARWLCAYATPGEAKLVADVVDQSWTQLSDRVWGPPSVLHPLASWLLERGSAELRSPDRSPLLYRIVELAADAAPAMLPAALRVMANRSNKNHQFGRNRPEAIWKALDAGLAEGWSSSLAIDLATDLREVGTAYVFLPENGLDHVRRALINGLLKDAFEQSFARQLWEWVSAAEPSTDVNVASASAATLERAMDAVSMRLGLGPPPGTRSSGPASSEQVNAQIGWLKLLLSSWFDAVGGFEGIRRSPTARTRLTSMAGLERHGTAPAEVIQDRLGREVDNPANLLALSILRQGALNPYTASSALRIILSTATKVPAPQREIPTSYGVHLRTLLNAAWSDVVFGLRPGLLLGAAREVAFAPLDGDDKVRSAGDVLLVDESYPRLLAGGTWSDEEQLGLLTLYVLHELVHVHQGIGDKRRVGALRDAGAESSLMHLDLAADHAAALLAAEGVRRWRLNWLKDLQGRSLADFPVGPTHPSGSRARKAARLVGIRLDWLVRELSILPRDQVGDGYVFAEYGPSGGTLLVLVSGPPVALATRCSLPGEAAQILHGAADEANVGAQGLARVDAALKTALDARLRD